MTGPRPVLDSGLGSGQGIWEVVTKPTLRVGTRGSLKDGRVFYYARSKSSSSNPAGYLLQAESISVQNTDLAVNTAQIGDESVTVTFGTDTADANDYTGGYMCVVDDSSQGVTYEIGSHAAITSGGSIVINLVDPIYLDFTSGTTVSVLKNLWQDIARSSSTTAVVVDAGVSQILVPVGNATAQYFWCQTWGVACVRSASDNLIPGAPMTHSINPASGGYAGFTSGQKPGTLGINLGATTATELAPVFLKISQ